jgi:hypothetical protein
MCRRYAADGGLMGSYRGLTPPATFGRRYAACRAHAPLCPYPPLQRKTHEYSDLAVEPTQFRPFGPPPSAFRLPLTALRLLPSVFGCCRIGVLLCQVVKEQVEGDHPDFALVGLQDRRAFLQSLAH